MNDVILKQKQYNHPIERVWKAISDAREISTWFIQADFKSEVGYEYTFTHEKSVITGKILEVSPVTKLVYTWVVKGTEAVTTVAWSLEQNQEGTLVTIEHSGISNYPGETAVKMFESFDGGWDGCMKQLNEFLQNEISVH